MLHGWCVVKHEKPPQVARWQRSERQREDCRRAVNAYCHPLLLTVLPPILLSLTVSPAGRSLTNAVLRL